MKRLNRRSFLALATLALSVFTGRAIQAVERLGTGTGSLLANDLTDFRDNGQEALYNPPANLGGFNATFFSSDEPGFGGGESAFNVFDNVLGPGNAKWCCGTFFPQIVGAAFEDAYRLTHFTVSSANDVAERDPRIWRIEGSNDGETWTTIFSQDDPAGSLWTDRLQVILFEEGSSLPSFPSVRFRVTGSNPFFNRR